MSDGILLQQSIYLSSEVHPSVWNQLMGNPIAENNVWSDNSYWSLSFISFIAMWEFDPIMPLISFFGVICMIPFMYIIIVYLVFISSIAKGLAMSRLGGEIK